MNQVQLLLAFSRTIETGSFSAVAREQGIAQSTVSKQIASLEASLGMQLFRRSTRQLNPTSEALRLYPHVRQLLDVVNIIQSEMDGQPVLGLSGTLKVTLPGAFGRKLVIPLIPKLLEQHPRLSLELVYSDNVLDLIEEGIELGIRTGPLPSSSLIARPLGLAKQIVTATPEYLRRHGQPESPQDLPGHSCIAYASTQRWSRWEFDSEHGRQTVEISGSVCVNDLDAMCDAVLAHLGISLLPEWRVREYISAGSLVELMPDFYAAPQQINIVYPQTRFLSQRARVFIDFLLENLAHA